MIIFSKVPSLNIILPASKLFPINFSMFPLIVISLVSPLLREAVFGEISKYKKEKWYQEFSSKFEIHSTYYKDSLNPVLKDKLLSLLEKDREFNRKYHEWRTREIEITLEELINSANGILDEFKSLTNKYGFPTEQLMGYNYVRRKNAVEHFPIDALMVHIYQRGVLIFENDIPEIVCEGGLHPKWKETLKKIRGFGNSKGIEQEMKARYNKFRGTE